MSRNMILVDFRLSEILQEKGLTKRKAAELTGLSENAIGSLSREGLQQIRIDTITALCNGLELSPADLFKTYDMGIGKG